MSMKGVCGNRLRARRRECKMRQVELAEAMGSRYNHSVISNVENGRFNLLLDGAIAASETLGVSLDWLVGLTDDPTPSYVLHEHLEQYTTGPPDDDIERRAMELSKELSEFRKEAWVAIGEEWLELERTGYTRRLAN